MVFIYYNFDFDFDFWLGFFGAILAVLALGASVVAGYSFFVSIPEGKDKLKRDKAELEEQKAEVVKNGISSIEVLDAGIEVDKSTAALHAETAWFYKSLGFSTILAVSAIIVKIVLGS